MELIQALRGLKGENNDRSETSRLRDVFNEIEAAMASGVKREAIVKTLRAQGFRMTLKSFESAVHRIRKERRAQTNTNAPAVGAERHPPSPVPTIATPPHAGPKPHDMADDDDDWDAPTPDEAAERAKVGGAFIREPVVHPAFAEHFDHLKNKGGKT